MGLLAKTMTTATVLTVFAACNMKLPKDKTQLRHQNDGEVAVPEGTEATSGVSPETAPGEAAGAGGEAQTVTAPAYCPTPALRLAAAAPTYQGQIKAIYDAKCVACHSAAAKPPRAPYFTSYDLAKQNTPQGVEKIQDGEMPPKNAKTKLADGDLSTIKAWAAAGYPNVAAAPPPADPAMGVAAPAAPGSAETEKDSSEAAAPAGAEPGAPPPASTDAVTSVPCAAPAP